MKVLELIILKFPPEIAMVPSEIKINISPSVFFDIAKKKATIELRPTRVFTVILALLYFGI